MKNLQKTFALILICIIFPYIQAFSTNEEAKSDTTKVYTIGDSTVQTYSDGYYPRKGWGQVLQNFFEQAYVEVENRAVGGTSAKSFYDYYWEGIQAELDSGDFVLIQFGINDSSSDTARYTSPYGTFQEYLTRYVEGAREMKAIPIIVATLRKNSWTNDSTSYNAYHSYPQAARDIADSLNTPLIDLDTRCKTLMDSLGKNYVSKYWYMNIDAGEYPGASTYAGGCSDNTHFQEMGAIEMARLIVSELQDMSDADSLASMISHIKEMHAITVNTSNDVALVTRTAYYPEGTPVTLKVKIQDEDYIFAKWTDTNNDSISSDSLIYITAGNKDVSYTAHFTSTVGLTDCNGDYLGDAYYDESGVCVEGNTGRFPCTITMPDTVSFIFNHSGLLMTGGNSVTQGTSGQDAQHWLLEASDYCYGIKNISSGKYLSYSSLVSDSALFLSEEKVNWRIEEISDDIFTISPEDSIDLLVTVPGGSVSEGKQLIISDRLSASNQMVRTNSSSAESDTISSYYIQKDSVIVIEAEHYNEIIAGSNGDNWVTGINSDASLDSVIIAPSGTSYGAASTAETDAPIVNYSVKFEYTGDYSVWARVYAPDDGSDSYHLGIDNEVLIEKIDLYSSTNVYNEFTWLHVDSKTLSVSETRMQNLSVFCREPNLIIDKIILSLNADYSPEDQGDNETLYTATSSNSSTTNIEKVQAESSFNAKVFPNPATDQINLEYDLTEAGLVNISMYNISGKKVASILNEYQQAGVNTLSYNINESQVSVTPGIYFIKIQGENCAQIIKVIIKF